MVTLISSRSPGLVTRDLMLPICLDYSLAKRACYGCFSPGGALRPTCFRCQFSRRPTGHAEVADSACLYLTSLGASLAAVDYCTPDPSIPSCLSSGELLVGGNVAAERRARILGPPGTLSLRPLPKSATKGKKKRDTVLQGALSLAARSDLPQHYAAVFD
ncbi:hypothetical protein Y1Q_0013093 [Alligator mississippiensis]|uniref:Uncharacterized protein n=1 Tax=Alligator mississippiensis TaxID=8496 RepID=A0A151NHS1_ALLMI|nr:hypothetical protein Y1Q_0013093 [Alligator mississippiensis]